ncbi:MAG: hypothetical protein IH963_14775 [Chloroflexi bacterium]|nr:hypothetical protein [Chloroflexota bacterium]
MKKYLSVFALVLILAVGALALLPISGSSSAAELDAESPRVFLAEMEGEVCASRSPVHTTSSLTAAKANADQGDTLPEIFLVMLEDGVCASLSPISISSRTPARADQSLFDQSESTGRNKAALGAETGVWYVQR